MNFGGRKPGFNTELKEQKTKTSTVNLITMAEVCMPISISAYVN